MRLLSAFFEAHGYEVDAVSSASEALVLLEKHHFDLVLSDANMEGMDGFGLCREVRHRYGKGVLFVLYTVANITDQTRKEAEDAGVDKFIHRFARLKEFLPVLEPLLETLLADQQATSDSQAYNGP